MSTTKEDRNWAQQVRNDLFLFSTEPDFTEMDLNDLFKALVIADDAYYNEAAIFTDEEYDAIRLFCQTADTNNTYFLGIGSQVRGGKVKLPYTMGSLTQAYQGETQKWIAQYELQNEYFVITEKLDGISTLIVYGNDGKMQIAYSRGDGIEGADITRHVSKIKNVPKQISGPLVVRAEIIFSKKNWDIVKTQIKRSGGAFYKNARNATAGLMNASESDPIAYQHLDVVAYEIISNQDLDKREHLDILIKSGFTTPSTKVFIGSQYINDNEMTKVVNQMRSNSLYEIDGIVIDINDSVERALLRKKGAGLNPEYARKYKIADASNQAIATVIEVQWNISKNGYFKPRVKIEPVELVGVTVQHATGFNAKFIFDNGIGPGAKIRITRSGDVIPFIQGVVEPANVTNKIPDEWKWNETGVDAVLVNANDNDTVKLEQLIDFFAKVGVEYLGEGNLQEIFNAGFKTVVDVINLSQFELTSLIGANGKKIHKSIREKLHNVPWYIVAGAYSGFGRGVGVRKMKKLYDAFSGDIKKLAIMQEILAVEGFEFKTAAKITSGYTNFLKFLTDTSATITFAEYEAPKQGGLSGSTFLFTGFRSSDLEAKIVEQGGKISSSVSSKLNYLVAADPNESSGKLTKARELGTKIITREELVDLLGA